MKKISLLAAAAALILCTSCSTTRKTTAFLPKAEMPDAWAYLLPPPLPGSAEFALDSIRYEWGKTIRPTPRGELAKQDAQLDAAYYSKIFSEPFGMEISKERTPEIFNLIERSIPTVRQSISDAKRKFARTRPFVYFGEMPFVPKDYEHLKDAPSYPSGHTVRGWSIALILSEVNPDAGEALLRRGFEYGESRVIMGVHYQSDVNAARLAASASVARLNVDKGFRRQLARAQKEFRARARKN